MLRIHKNNSQESLQVFKEIRYEDFINVNFERYPKNLVRLRYTFKFELHTKQRAFVLQAASIEERWMWLHTLYWILAKYKLKSRHLEQYGHHLQTSPGKPSFISSSSFRKDEQIEDEDNKEVNDLLADDVEEYQQSLRIPKSVYDIIKAEGRKKHENLKL